MKALFWDFDGTLTESKPLWTNSVYNAINSQNTGVDVSFEFVRSHMAFGFPWHNYDRDNTKLVNDAYWEFIFAKFNTLYQAIGIDRMHFKNINNKAKELLLDMNSYTVYPDASLTLQECQNKGYKNYILSNNYPELKDAIAQLGLSGFFEDYFVSGLIGYDKPRKEIFEIALQKTGYPDVCFMIGDNPEADIKGAKQVGMKTILVHKNNECGADFSFGSLAEIKTILP